MSDDKTTAEVNAGLRLRVREALDGYAAAATGDSNDAEAEVAQDLAELLSEVTGVPMAEVRDPVDDARAARAAESIAVLLGAADDWDGGADFLEDIAEIIHHAGFRHPGNAENQRYYRAAYPDWNE